MRAPAMLSALSAAFLISGWITPAASEPAIDSSFAAVEAAPWKRHYARDLGNHTIFVDEVWAPDDFPGSADVLRKALKKSLSAFALESADRSRAEYALTALVFEFVITEAPRLKSTTAQVGIKYAILDAHSDAPVFEETIRTQFTARAPRKNAAAEVKNALAKTHSKRELMTRLAAQQKNAKPDDFLKAKCAAKDEAQGGVGDGGLSSEARKSCAQNHAVHANLEAFFARLLAYRSAQVQTTDGARRSSMGTQR